MVVLPLPLKQLPHKTIEILATTFVMQYTVAESLIFAADTASELSNLHALLSQKNS